MIYMQFLIWFLCIELNVISIFFAAAVIRHPHFTSNIAPSARRSGCGRCSTPEISDHLFVDFPFVDSQHSLKRGLETYGLFKTHLLFTHIPRATFLLSSFGLSGLICHISLCRRHPLALWWRYCLVLSKKKRFDNTAGSWLTEARSFLLSLLSWFFVLFWWTLSCRLEPPYYYWASSVLHRYIQRHDTVKSSSEEISDSLAKEGEDLEMMLTCWELVLMLQ